VPRNSGRGKKPGAVDRLHGVRDRAIDVLDVDRAGRDRRDAGCELDAQHLAVGPAASDDLLIRLGGVRGHQVTKHQVVERDRRLIDQLNRYGLLAADRPHRRVDERVGEVDIHDGLVVGGLHANSGPGQDLRDVDAVGAAG